MTQIENEKRICSIDIFRYICAIMIIIIHTHPFEEIDADLGLFFTKIFSRIALPFFFAISGFAYARTRETKNSDTYNWWKSISKYFYIYLIWSLVYLPLSIYTHIKIDKPDTFNLIIILFKNFFIKGTYFHLWFFPALILSISLAYFLEKIKASKKSIIASSLILYFIGCSSYFYSDIFSNNIGIINIFKSNYFNIFRRMTMIAFPFFINGFWTYYIWEKHKSYLQVKQKHLLILLFVFIFLNLMKIFVTPLSNLTIKIIFNCILYPLVMNIFLVLLVYPIYNWASIASTCRYLASYTYFTHPLFIFFFNELYQIYYSVSMPQTAKFFSVCLATLLSGLLFYYLKYKSKMNQ